MTDTSTYGKYPIPTSPEAPDAPAQFMNLVQALDEHTVLWALNAADRDAEYAAVLPGTIVSSTTAPWSVWQKKTGSGWNSLYEDTGWVDLADVWGADWDDVGTQYRIKNSRTQLSLRLQYTGSDVTSPANGNVGDITLGVLPDQAKPIRSQEPSVFLASTAGWIDYYVNGDVKITHMIPTGVLSTGTVLYASHSFFRD